MDRYLTSSTFACNTRYSLQGLKSGFEDGTIGPVYPMEFRIRNCDPNGQPGEFKIAYGF